MAADRDEIRAVRKVLYDRRRMRRLDEQVSTINGLMNLDPTIPLQTDDIRQPGGSGPNWFIAATGAVDPFVIEAADRCGKVADLLREIRQELADLQFDGSDKRHLREGLDRLAKSWEARGRAWRKSGPPAENDPDWAAIDQHFKASVRQFRRVDQYLGEDEGRTP